MKKLFMKLYVFPYKSLLYMQRRFGYVTGAVLWIGIIWVVGIVTMFVLLLTKK